MDRTKGLWIIKHVRITIRSSSHHGQAHSKKRTKAIPLAIFCKEPSQPSHPNARRTASHFNDNFSYIHNILRKRSPAHNKRYKTLGFKWLFVHPATHNFLCRWTSTQPVHPNDFIPQSVGSHKKDCLLIN
jgi:hypothetical protein